MGTLLDIEGEMAVIKNVKTKKRNIKVPLADCEPYLGEIKMTIFDQLYAIAAKCADMKKQGPEHSDEQYLRVLLEVIGDKGKVSNEEWNRLSIPAQTWFNDAVVAIRAMKPIPPCPGFIGRGESRKITQTSSPPKGLSAVEALASQPSKFQTVPPTFPREKKVVTGVMDAIRRVVILHPEWTSRQVYDYLKSNGYPNAKLDSISVDRGNIHRVIEIMKELGWQEPQKEIEKAV